MFNYKRRILFPLIFAAVLLCASMAWLFVAMYQLIDLSERKDVLDQQRYYLVALGRSISEAESGQRGYLLTGATIFLETLEHGRTETKRYLNIVHDQAQQYPEMHAIVEKTKSLVDEKFFVMDRNIHVQLNAGAYAPHLTLSKDRSRELMGQITAQLGVAESVLINVRTGYERSIRHRVIESVLGAIVLVMLILGVLLFSYRRTSHLFESIIENKNIADQLSYQATHDLLTGLPNRRCFDQQLNKVHSIAQRTPKKIAIFFMDLDGFKQVNDTFGHEIGDALLIKVAESFTRVLRQYDFLARLGGDEFVLLVEHYEKRNELVQLAERLINVLSQPMVLASHMVNVGVSIGVAEYPHDGERIEDLLHAADHAMYLSKKQGKRCCTFAADMDKAALLATPKAPLAKAS